MGAEMTPSLQFSRRERFSPAPIPGFLAWPLSKVRGMLQTYCPELAGGFQVALQQTTAPRDGMRVREAPGWIGASSRLQEMTLCHQGLGAAQSGGGSHLSTPTDLLPRRSEETQTVPETARRHG